MKKTASRDLQLRVRLKNGVSFYQTRLKNYLSAIQVEAKASETKLVGVGILLLAVSTLPQSHHLGSSVYLILETIWSDFTKSPGNHVILISQCLTAAALSYVVYSFQPIRTTCLWTVAMHMVTIAMQFDQILWAQQLVYTSLSICIFIFWVANSRFAKSDKTNRLWNLIENIVFFFRSSEFEELIVTQPVSMTIHSKLRTWTYQTSWEKAFKLPSGIYPFEYADLAGTLQTVEIRNAKFRIPDGKWYATTDGLKFAFESTNAASSFLRKTGEGGWKKQNETDFLLWELLQIVSLVEDRPEWAEELSGIIDERTSRLEKVLTFVTCQFHDPKEGIQSELLTTP